MSKHKPEPKPTTRLEFDLFSVVREATFAEIREGLSPILLQRLARKFNDLRTDLGPQMIKEQVIRQAIESVFDQVKKAIVELEEGK
jgi:hypothetical protein